MKGLIVLLFLSVWVQADYLLQYKMSGDRSTFYYKDADHQKLRLSSDICKSGEVYKTPKGVYAVNYSDGRLMVVDLLKARSFMESMGMQASPQDYGGNAGNEAFDRYMIKKSSHAKYIAGIKAYKWTLIDKKSKKEQIVYVSDDKKLVKISKALYALFTTATPQQANAFLLQNRYTIVKAEGFELESFKKVFKPLSFYTLPRDSSQVPKQCRKSEKEIGEDQLEDQEEPRSTSDSESESITPEDIQQAADLLKSLF